MLMSLHQASMELSLLPFLLRTALILFTFSFLFSLSLFQSFPPANGRGVHRLDCKSWRHSGFSLFSSYPGFWLFPNIFILIKPRPLHSVSKSPQMYHMGNETNNFIFSTILQIGETTFGIQQSWVEEMFVPNIPLSHQHALKLTCEPESCRDPVDSCDDVIQRRKLQGLTTCILKWANGKSHAPKMRTRSRLPQRSYYDRKRMSVALWGQVISKLDKTVTYISWDFGAQLCVPCAAHQPR